MTDISRRIQRHLYEDDTERRVGSIEVNIDAESVIEKHDKDVLHVLNAIEDAVKDVMDNDLTEDDPEVGFNA